MRGVAGTDLAELKDTLLGSPAEPPQLFGQACVTTHGLSESSWDSPLLEPSQQHACFASLVALQQAAECWCLVNENANGKAEGLKMKSNKIAPLHQRQDSIRILRDRSISVFRLAKQGTTGNRACQ